MEFFQSHYRAPWVGVLLIEQKRKGIAPLCTFLIVQDQHGNRPRRKLIMVLDKTWLKPHDPVDVSWVNPFWFIP